MANSKGGNIEFGIGFKVDKSGLKDIESSLRNLVKATPQDLFGAAAGSEKAKTAMSAVREQAANVRQALKDAYNPTLSTLNIDKFNQSLKNSDSSLNQVYQAFSAAGTKGNQAFNSIAREVLTTNVKLKQTHSILESMGTTMINTIKWSAASTVMNAFTGSISNAYNYVKALDGSLTDIRIVTGNSKEQMDEFANSANKAAQALGRQTKEYTNAALTFYQQGLSDDEVQVRTETTLKAANITGAEASSVADQLTAVWNGFQVSLEDTEDIVSKMAAVADSSASNMSELATAMSKVASVANNMGVDVDQLNAQIATIIATTRQAPQTVGNALKTIYARINDIKAGTDEAEMSLGNYTGKMAELGVNVLDSNGRLRDTGDVMEQIGERWSTMTREQQIYLTQTMAGQRQMNNLMALFEHWDMYTKELNVSLQAQGTLDQKNAVYMESLAAHTRELEAASEGLIQAFVNGDSFIGIVDTGTKILNLFTDIVDAIGGGGNAIIALGGIFTQVFSKQISKELNTFVTNFQNAAFNKQQIKQLEKNALDMANLNGVKNDDVISTLKQRQTSMKDLYTMMSQEEINHYNQLIKDEAIAKQQVAILEEQEVAAKKVATALLELSKEESEAFEFQAKNDKLGELQVRIQNLEQPFENLNEKINNFSEQVHAGNYDDSVFDELKNDLIDLAREIGYTQPQIEDFEKSLENQKPAQQLRLINQEYRNVQKNVENAALAVEDLGQKQDEATKKQKAATNAVEEFQQKQKQAYEIQAITRLIGSLTTLVGIYGSLSTLGATWADNSISSTERLEKSFTSLISILPMAITSLKAVKDGITAIGITSKMAFPLVGGLIAAIGAATAVYSGYKKNQQEARKATLDDIEAKVKHAKQVQNELKQNQDLQQSYLEVYQRYKEGQASMEDVREASEKLNDIYGNEILTIAQLTGNYDLFTQSLINNRQERIRLAQESNKTALKELQQGQSAYLAEAGFNTKNEFQLDDVLYAWRQNYSKEISRGWGFASKEIQDLAGQSNFLQYNYDKAFGYSLIYGFDQLTEDTLPTIYEDLNNLINYIGDVGNQQSIALSALRDSLKPYVQQIEEIQKNLLEGESFQAAEDLNYSQISSFESYLKKRDQLQTRLKEIYPEKDKKEIEQILISTAQAYGGAISNFEQKTQALNNILRRTLDTEKEDVQNYLTQLSDEDFNIVIGFQGKVNEENLDNYLKASKEKVEEYTKEISGDLAENLLNTFIEKGVDKLDEKTIEELQKLIDQTEGLDASDKALFEGLISVNTTQKDRIQILSNYLKTNEKVINSVEELTQAYQDQQKALKQAELDSLNEELKKAEEDLKFSETLYQAGETSQLKHINELNKGIDNLKESISFAEFELNSIANGVVDQQAQLEYISQNYQKSVDTLTGLNNIQVSLIDSVMSAIQEDDLIDSQGMFALIEAGFTDIYDHVDKQENGLYKIRQDYLNKIVSQSKTDLNNYKIESINLLNELNGIIDQNISLLEAEKKTADEARIKAIDQELQRLENQKARNNVVTIQIDEQISQAETKTQNVAQHKGGNYKEETKSAEESLTDIQSLVDQIFKGSFLEGTDWDDFVSILNQLEEVSPELTADIELLKQSALQGTEVYLTALSRLQEKINEIKLDNLIEQSNQASDSFKESFDALFQDGDQLKEKLNNATAIDFEESAAELSKYQQNVDAFMSRLSEYTAAQYAIDIEVHTQAEQAFDQINDLLQGLEDAGNKIGQNFIVAGSDLRELNNAFPGILEGMQVLADGTYQLNQDIAQSAIESATVQAAARADAIRSQLEDQSKLLHKKAQIYTKMADAAAILAQSQIHSEEESDQARAALSAGLAELQQTNSELASNQAMLNQQAVANSAMANGQAMAVNWRNAAQSAAQSIYQFALNACANMAEVAKGEDGKPTLPDISSSFSGMSGVSMEASAMSSAKDAIEGQYEQDFAALEQQFRALADMSEASANDIDGMLAEIGANANSIADGVRNIGEGRKWGDNGTDSGKSGGGGGGKNKTKSADQIQDMKLKNEQIDLYHELDRAIKATQETIDDYDKAKKKTVRNGLAKTIDNQIEELEKQKGLYEQKIGMMQAQLQAQQANLAALGVQFDEQGNIINYTGLMIEYQNLYNSLLEEAKFLTGDAQEGKLRQAEAVKAKLDALRSQMGAYEALQDKITEAGNAIQDILDKEEELRIEQFKINIDVQLDFAEAERDWNEFRKKVIDQIKDDDYVGQATARLADFDSYYKPDGGGIIQELTEHVNRTREEAEIIQNGGVSSIYGRNEAQALEDLKHYTDELMQNLEDVEQIAKDIQDLYLDTIKKAKDAFDDQIGQYEQIAKLLEHDINLIQLVHPRDNEEELARYYDLIHQNNLQQIDMYRKQVDMWKERMDAAEEGTQAWKEFRDNWEDSLNSMNDAVEAAVENLITRYETVIEKIVRETRDSMVGGDWQAALDEWDKNQWLSDFALDPLERATALADVLGDIDKDINNSKNLQYQRDLLKLRDAILDDAEKQEYLTETEVKMYQMQLELMQRQQALRQAEQSKTTMRLRRDSQGNYTYQFVADEDNIADKRQQLRDLWEEYRQLLSTDLPEIQNSIIERTQQYWDKYKELSLEFYDDQELLKEKLAELEEQYYGEEGYITILANEYYQRQGQAIIATGGQLSAFYQEQGEALRQFLGIDDSEEGDSVWGAIKTLINADDGLLPDALKVFTTETIPQNFDKINEDTQDLLFSSLQPSWDTLFEKLTYQILNVDKQFEDTSYNIQNYLQNVIIPATNQALAAAEEYQNGLNILAETAGIDLAYIGSGLNYDVAATQALIYNNAELINSYNNEISAIQAVVNQIASLVNEYDAARAAAIAAAEAAMQFWMAALGYGVDLSSPDYGGGTASASSPGASGSSSGSGGGSGGSSSGSGGSRSSSSGLETRTYVSSNGDIYQTTGSGSNPEANRLKKANTTLSRQGMAMFDTGGYTGNWVNDVGSGKLAILHDKELVLNQNDTANILSAVEYMRGIVDKVGNLNNNLSGLSGNFLIGTTTNNNDNSTSQNIVINADFPGVSDALEIKNAFNNLMNIASQYANGNRRTY